MKRTFYALIALLTALPSFANAAQIITITNNNGGLIDEFILQRERWRQQKVEVRIAGRCASACTMYLQLPKFCVYRGAELWFHQPTPNYPLARWALMNSYPKAVQTWIFANGGLTADWIILKGEELHRLVPSCKS